MTHKDQVTRLLGALKDWHRLHMEAIGLGDPELVPDCPTCQLIAKIEADLTAESSEGFPLEKRFETIKDVAIRTEQWIIAAHARDALRVLRGYAPLESLNPVTPSPTNACIRAAKRVIAALNLPEGGGVAWTPTIGWVAFLRKSLPGKIAWAYETGFDTPFLLPATAIPPWPGDWRESWITKDTEEV